MLHCLLQLHRSVFTAVKPNHNLPSRERSPASSKVVARLGEQREQSWNTKVVWIQPLSCLCTAGTFKLHRSTIIKVYLTALRKAAIFPKGMFRGFMSQYLTLNLGTPDFECEWLFVSMWPSNKPVTCYKLPSTPRQLGLTPTTPVTLGAREALI